MGETVIVRELSRPDVELPMDRDEFYREQIRVFKEKGAPTKAVDIIQVFIFNGYGEMLVQKRSFDKNHNPGLLDKSIGGHVKYGDTPDYTVMVETVQELQTPSIVLREEGLFKKTKFLLDDYLDTVAIIEHHGGDICKIGKIIDKERVVAACRVHLYFGIYNGRVRPTDREAKGVLWYTLKELDSEMKKFPDTFTEDTHFFMERYRKDMEGFLAAS
jgi:isopentenyldiphosphate isomerase